MVGLLWRLWLVLWAYILFVFLAPRPESSQLYSMIHAQIEKGVFVIFLLSLGVLIFGIRDTKVGYTN